MVNGNILRSVLKLWLSIKSLRETVESMYFSNKFQNTCIVYLCHSTQYDTQYDRYFNSINFFISNSHFCPYKIF